MKKIILASFAIVALAATLFVSCKKTQTTNTAREINQNSLASLSNSELLTMFANVGTDHNEAMDFIYDELVAYKNAEIALHSEFKVTESEMFDQYHQFATNYVSQKWAITSTEATDINNSTKTFNTDFIFNETPYSAEYIENVYASITFSSDFKTAYNDMIAIVEDDNLNEAQKNTAWDNLLSSSLNTLEDEHEKAAMIAGINTAKATYSYWSNQANMDKWSMVLTDQPNGPSTMRQISQNTKNDIQGAVGGAAGFLAAYGGTAAAFGPGAVIAVGVVGAVHGASTGTAGAVIWDKIWSWIEG